MPLLFELTIAFLLGSIIGSFGNVVVCRLHTGRSLSGNSHCLSCGRRLAWYELVPIISYVALLGRCRTCGCWIPSRYLLVEGATAASFVLVAYTTEALLSTVLLFAVTATLVMIATYDLYHLIIPNELVLIAVAIGVVLVGYESYGLGDSFMLLTHSTAALVAFAVYAGLWLVSGGRWIGFGDAKLAVPLALIVGLSGTFSLIVLSFWIGAVLSVGYVSMQYARRVYASAGVGKTSRYLTMKHEVPFAPFLILAFYVVQFLHTDVLALTAYVLY